MILTPHTVELTIILFLLYWLVGGVFFAVIALFRSTKLNKAQFSCLFTLATVLCAFGATVAGTAIGGQGIDVCLRQVDGYFASLAAVITCGVLPLTFSALVGFLILLLLGALFLIISRSKNQSWVDGRSPKEPPMPGVVTPIDVPLEAIDPHHPSADQT